MATLPATKVSTIFYSQVWDTQAKTAKHLPKCSRLSWTLSSSASIIGSHRSTHFQNHSTTALMLCNGYVASLCRRY